jgi:arsenite methyltransferase
VDNLTAHSGAAARKAATGVAVIEDWCDSAIDACCGPVAKDSTETFGAGLYDATELAELPAEAVAGSIGCANPVALARLEPGEDVLDLGSGGGIDVLLSARRVGPQGRAYGVDMTAEMLSLARANQAKAGVDNAEFLEGRIEAVPLPDLSVDVVVSNCVINLSADKDAVFTEAHRVLRPGGRLAVADVVADHEPAAELLADDAAWAACIAGAVTRDRYRDQLEGAGFGDVEIVDSHPVAAGFWSVFVRASKPAES